MRAGLLTRRRLLCGSAIGLSAASFGIRLAAAGIDPTQAVAALLCDIVIPDTDTPGARAAGVPEFLPFAFAHGLFGGDAGTLAELTRHLDALAGGQGFLGEDAAAQLRIMSALDHATFARGPAAKLDSESQRLWRIMKSAIVTSFYTSESGGSRTLTYELVPGRYDADVPLGQDPYLSNFWIENIF